MKETPIFEEVFNRVIRQPGFWAKALIGGLLSFVPIVNFFAFGYLLRLSRSVRQTGQLQLPEWNDFGGLFMDGVKFAVVWLAYWFLPILLAGAIFKVLVALGLSAIAYLIFASVFLLAPILFSSALYRYNMKSDFRDLLDVALIVRMTTMELSVWLIPALVFVALFALAMPLYGFPLFIGFLLLIMHSSLRLRGLERN